VIAEPSSSSSSSVSGGRAALLTAARAELIEHGHSGISLRAVARRAGLSHGAPKHHFDDRAGLLTAVAAEGFRALAEALRAADIAADADARTQLTALGRAYLDFGLAHPALFDLMYRPSELRLDDPELRAAQRASTAVLAEAAGRLRSAPVSGSVTVPSLALISWALVHGLVALTRDGALTPFVDGDADPADLAHALTALFAEQVSP
jgi:AcrR family transcriptional regulator